MALVKYGAGVTGMSGTAGGNVYARNRAGNYARSWRKPVNTPSSFRSAVRGEFGAQAGVWSTLSREIIAAWNALASTATRLNRLGEPFVPTGRQIFMESNLNLVKAGLPAITAAPANLAVPDNTSRPVLTATITAGALSVLSVAGIPVGLKAVVRMTPPLPAARTNVNDQLRTIGPVTGAASVDLLALYTARLGADAVAGQVLTAAIQLINEDNGMASPETLTRLTLT